MKCNNCNELTTGKYCSNCGQKVSVARLSLHELFHDTWHAVTHADKGILRVVKDLTFSPVLFYKSYFGGQRKKYFSPVLFFLLTAGIVAVLYGYVFSYQDKVFNTNNEFGKIAYHETKFRALFVLPVQIFITWLVFRKKYNIAEITVFWLFAWGLTYCVRIIFIPLYFPLIAYKDVIDFTLFYAAYLIIFWQGLALFGRNIQTIVIMFVIVNISIVLDMAVVLFLLFGYNIFDNPLGVHTFWDLIKAAYT